MAEKQFGVRLSAEGGDKVRAELLGIGQVGQEAFQDVADAANRSRRPIEEVGERAARVGQRAGMGSHGLRQFSLQLNQVAQSGAVTGQWMQSLAIQIPDMLLAFGTFGAVAGTLAALLIPLGTNLAKVAFAAGDVEGALDKAEDSLKAFARAADNSAASRADLIKQYGAAADEVERLHRVQLAAARTTAMQDLLKVGDALGSMAGDDRYAGTLRGSTGIQDLMRRYRITREEAESLAAALRQVDQAGSFEEALPAATTLIERLKDAGITSGDLWEQANRMADTAKGGIAAMNAELGHTLTLTRQAQTAFRDMVSGAFERWTGRTPVEWRDLVGSTGGGILDLIGHAEGTDRGRGYNETLDYGRWTGGPVNLTSMTLDEILELGRRMRTPENRRLYPGGGSSALGRYQIVGETLRDLMGRLDLRGDELFDEAMQDRLAMELVRMTAPHGVEAMQKRWVGLSNVPGPVITSALGAKSVGIDPATEARRREAERESTEEIKRQNAEWQKNLDVRADWLAGIENEVQAAALQASAIGKSTYEIAFQRAEMRLTQELQAKGISLTEKLWGEEKTYGQLVQETAHALAMSAQETEVLQGRQEDWLKTLEENAERMKRFREDFVGDFTSAFMGVIDGTKKVSQAFGDMLKSMAARWAEAGLNKLGGWLFDSLFGGGMGVVSAFPGDPLAGALSAIIMHNGGTVGAGGMTRRVHPAVFAGAQRYHSGGWPGLRADEVPAVLQRGERVQSRAEVAMNGGGESTIKLLLAPGLIAEVLDKAREQSVQVIKEHTPGIVQRAVDTSVKVNSETRVYE